MLSMVFLEHEHRNRHDHQDDDHPHGKSASHVIPGDTTALSHLYLDADEIGTNFMLCSGPVPI
jgi:hypothetical protein